MNRYLKISKPLLLWFIDYIVLANDRNSQTKPVNGKEFYGSMALITLALVVMSVIFHMIK